MSDKKLIFFLNEYILYIEKVVNYAENTVSSYRRDLQFDLLNSLAETISYSLEQYIQK